MPDTTWPISRHPPGSIPGWAGRPVSMSSIAVFDTSSVVRSRSPSWPTPDALTARLTPRTLTTTALDRSSSGWLAASPCRATAEDHRPQGRPLHLRCNTASVSPTFYTDLLSAFVAHPAQPRSPRRPLSRSRDRTAGPGQTSQERVSRPETRVSVGAGSARSSQLLLWKTSAVGPRRWLRGDEHGHPAGVRLVGSADVLA
jgi:hypothetical protein